jgi:uncharacterized membrane protein YecN with MAPEG domain
MVTFMLVESPWPSFVTYAGVATGAVVPVALVQLLNVQLAGLLPLAVAAVGLAIGLARVAAETTPCNGNSVRNRALRPARNFLIIVLFTFSSHLWEL